MVIANTSLKMAVYMYVFLFTYSWTQFKIIVKSLVNSKITKLRNLTTFNQKLMIGQFRYFFFKVMCYIERYFERKK